MKKNLLEYAIGSLEVVEERKDSKGEKELDVKVMFQQADIINGNGRRYKKGLLEREIKKIQTQIDRGTTVWGHAFHPSDGVGRPQDISHKWKKIWMEDDGTCFGKITVLPTEAGKNVGILIKKGKLGISSRGFGTTTEKEEVIDGKRVKFLDVNNDYQMKTPGDFVVSPSVAGAGNVNEELLLLESKLNGAEIPEDKKREDTVKKTKKGYSLERLEEIMLTFYQQDKDFRGSFDQWKEEYALPIYAKAMVEEGICESVEEGLKMINAGVEKKEPRRKITPKDVLFEAQIAGISAIELAKKINMNIAREAEEAKDDLTIEERVRILNEAHIAGVDTRNSEERKRVLETARKQKGKITIEKPEPLTEAEKRGRLGAERRLAGYGNSLIESKKNKE